MYVFHLGSAAAIESYLETHRRIDDSASLARRLVQLEIDNPIARGVGAPIDLLRISALARNGSPETSLSHRGR